MAKKKSEAAANLYILLGPETGNKNIFVETLLQKARKEHGEVERYKFYPYDADIGNIVSLIKTPSLFSACRFVIFANMDVFKKNETDLLMPALKTVSHDLYIIILSDLYKLDKRIEELCLPANKKIFWEMKENDREHWLRSFFRSSGHTITPDAVERLLELIENNLQDLKIAAESLAGFCPKERPISEEDIDRLIIHNKEENIFTLFSHLAQRNLEGAVESLNQIAFGSEGAGVSSVTGLIWQFRRLVALKEHTEAGRALNEEAFRSLAVIGKRSQQLYQQALRRYTLKELRTIMTQLTDCDELLRSGLNKELQHIALDNFLIGCCRAAR
jgi:DNA polymerase-3 subunit delta